MTEQAQRSVTREARWERTKANIKTIGGAVLLALFIRIVLFEAFEIDGPSMEPTLLHGDRVVVAKFMYGLFIPWTNEALINWGTPNVGNVVIVHSPFDNEDIVKRVIGVPGDRIEVREEPVRLRDGTERTEQVVYRNGHSILRAARVNCEVPREELVRDDPEAFICRLEGVDDHTWLTGDSLNPPEDPLTVRTVPEGHIFVLGDHRDRSNDSRRIGFIPASRVKGRALAIYWSNDAHIRWDRIFASVR